MTDSRPDPDDAELNDQLATWFQGEVRQAAADLRRSPLRPARGRTIATRSSAGPAVAAIAVVILVIAGISRLPALTGRASEPTGTAGPSASGIDPQPTGSTAPTATPAASPGIGDRYQDGIPAVVDGERVIRPNGIGGEFRLVPGSFLIGGWLLHTKSTRLCPVAQSPLVPCGNPVLALTPLAAAGALSVVPETGSIDDGPVVLRVHMNDRRAARCPPAQIVHCGAALVVESVLWTDDEVTRTAPISTIHAMNRLGSLVPGSELSLLPRAVDPRLFDPVASCDPGFPVQMWTTPGLTIAMVLVFPSVAQRDAVDDNFTAWGWRGTYPADQGPCMVTTDSLYFHEWVTRHNVMVAVQVDVDGATPAQKALVDAVSEALREP